MTELSVVIPTHRRSDKLRTLIDGIAATASDRDAFEVVLVVDGLDEGPLEVGGRLPDDIRFVGLTKPHAGPAAARNHGIEHARGEWVLFYDDDARIDADTIPRHLAHIRHDAETPVAHLGRVDWPAELLDSPWRILLAETSMLFFWHRMNDHESYGFRHFWTSNLSVRRELVREVGGFSEAFPSAMHEDIELGWRLQETFGLQVRVDKSIHSLHDHPLEPVDYFRREHKSGVSARAARDINRVFHDEIWPWAETPESGLAMLEDLFVRPGRDVIDLLNRWAEPSDRRPSVDELNAAYLAHLPVKRLAFLHGYLERPFDTLWEQLTCPS